MGTGPDASAVQDIITPEGRILQEELKVALTRLHPYAVVALSLYDAQRNPLGDDPRYYGHAYLDRDEDRFDLSPVVFISWQSATAKRAVFKWEITHEASITVTYHRDAREAQLWFKTRDEPQGESLAKILQSLTFQMSWINTYSDVRGVKRSYLSVP